jgi:branched-chain amino acid transport system permease protein
MKTEASLLFNIKLPIFVLAAAFFFWMPSLLNSYLQHVSILILYFAFIGSAWNILGGFTGQMCFGQAAFFGIGAYVSSLLLVKAGISPWIGMGIGGVCGAVVGAFMGYLTFRYQLKGVFFALATFAFAEMLRIVAMNLKITGEAMGVLIPLQRNPSFLDFQFNNKIDYYYIILSMVIMILLACYKLDRSKFGYYLKAIREDEEAAGSLGINILKYKMFAIVISAFFTALGGTFYAQYMYYIDPGLAFGVDTTIEMIIRPMIGGLGTVFGPLIGSAVLETLSEVMRTLLADYRGLHITMYGTILILVMIFIPNGIMGLFKIRRNQHSRESMGQEL